MSAYFLDSSAAAKRYMTEAGSPWIKGLFSAHPPNEFYAAATIGVEVVAAITRRARGGTIHQKNAVKWCAVFLADLDADFESVNVTEDLLRAAVVLAQTHALRGYDAVQLAAGIEINRLRIQAGLTPIIFVSADKELNAAALAEGLTVDDPNNY